MACSHCTETSLGQAQGRGQKAMGTTLQYRNVHTGPRQKKEAVPVLVSVPYSVNKTEPLLASQVSACENK